MIGQPLIGFYAMNSLGASFAAGYACLSAWSDLLDRINVYPVADGDTGTNLRISLAPLREAEKNNATVREQLARGATGNSGNIAAAFFMEFCQAQGFSELAEKAAAGREKAWRAIATPCAGTMLSVFDSLAVVLGAHDHLETICHPLSCELQQAVAATSQLLPDLKKAGVVDAGALAMYLFFDGFFNHLAANSASNGAILELFAGKLAVNSSYRPTTTDRYCVDAVMHLADRHPGAKDSVAALGESVVMVEDEAMLKVHIHSPDPEWLRDRLGSLGDIVHWSAVEIDQGRGYQPGQTAAKSTLRIVTDGAGSITREMATDKGVTLLDSYIIIGDCSRPESLFCPDDIYPLMRAGHKITTAQASTFERHQHYRSICQQFGRSLYLCVGSAFTGNYAAAMTWKKDHDPENLLTVVDTGAASGRLALIVLLTARQAENGASEAGIIDFVQKTMAACTEYVFIDELKYLVAGGRVSRAGGFFGDLLSMKPVISPTSEGVRKLGMVHSRKGQLAFAMARLREHFDTSAAPMIMLQYSDNKQWLAENVVQKVRALLPQAEIILTQLSLTSGVHMGPGTWSVAFADAETP